MSNFSSVMTTNSNTNHCKHKQVTMSKLENVLEIKFLSMIKPLHYISCIFFLRKFNIIDNKIYPNARKYILCLGIGMFLTNFLLITCLISLINIYDVSIFYVYVLAYSQYSINYSILCFSNIIYSKFNIQLLLKLQAIDRYLYNAKDTIKIKFVVWFACILLIFTYILFVTFKLMFDPLWDWIRGLFIVISLIFDIELIYCIFFVYYLACKMVRWSEIIQVDENNPNVLQDDIGITLVEMLFKVYEQLLDALVLVKKAAQFAILLHFVIMFIQSITYIEILILMTQTQKLQEVSIKSHGYGVILWTSKAVVTETTFCFICEILYRRIISAQIVVISYMNFYTCRRSRRLFKNIRRLNRIKFSKMSICGIFIVDAALPLRLAALLTDYTVILLQFAFLRN
nr:gustatory receptor 28 [Papilio xuthus]